MGLDKTAVSVPDLECLASSTRLADRDLHHAARFAVAYLHLRAALAGLGAIALSQHAGVRDEMVIRSAALKVGEEVERSRLACPSKDQPAHLLLRFHSKTVAQLALGMATEAARICRNPSQSLDAPMLLAMARVLRTAAASELGAHWSNPISHGLAGHPCPSGAGHATVEAQVATTRKV